MGKQPLYPHVPKSQRQLTVDELSRLTFEAMRGIPDAEQTQGVGSNRHISYRHATIAALDTNGEEHNYHVQVSSNNVVTIKDSGKTEAQRIKNLNADWNTIPYQIRTEVERLWPELNITQKIIMGNLYAGRPEGPLGIKAVVGGRARDVFQREFPGVDTIDGVIRVMRERGRQLVNN